MEQLTIYDFPHFEKFEAMYYFFAGLPDIIFAWNPSYIVNSLFSAFLHTISFFIVATRYDTLQKRREFLKKFEEIFVFFEKTYLDKDWEDFRNDLWKLIESEEIKRDGVFNKKFRLDIIRCLYFSDHHALQELRKKKNERRAVWSQSVHDELWYDEPNIQAGNMIEKLRRRCKWICL